MQVERKNEQRKRKENAHKTLRLCAIMREQELERKREREQVNDKERKRVSVLVHALTTKEKHENSHEGTRKRKDASFNVHYML